MISVIVPIYNVAPYLDRCIQSICAQTYRDMEMILVNDGSTDACPEICEAYRKKDRRIRVIHKENGGLVSARQAGIQAAEGDFVGWVDGDDWIEPDYFEKMVSAQKASGSDIVAAGHVHDIGAAATKIMNQIPAGTYQRDSILPRLIYSGHFFEYGLQPHVFTKLIRSEILKRTEMAVSQRICTGEDAAVIYLSILEANQITVTNICGYHYVQRQGSLMKTSQDDELARIQILMQHLEQVFGQKNVLAVMRPQLIQYRKYLLFLRNMKILDQHSEQQLLLPYGGIPCRSRVVIYGAGGLGQKMYRYLSDCAGIEIRLWADQKFPTYQAEGMDVHAPDEIAGLDGQYDYVLIAHTMETVADAIRNYLLELRVPAEKIRWFSQEFINR